MQRAFKFLNNHPYWFAATAGGLSALGFEPWGLWPLTLICFALLIWLTAQAAGKKRALLTGWLFGIGHFSIGLQWIAVSFTYQAAMPPWLGYISVVLLSLYLAIYPALAALGAWWIGKLAGRKQGISLPYILAFAGFWIITEWLRSWVFTGFAWNSLGVVLIGGAFYEIGIVSPLATWLGTYGLSGVLALFAGLIARGFSKQLDWGSLTAKQQLFEQGKVATVLFAAIAIFYFVDGPEQPSPPMSETNITIVQPNVTQEERNDPLMENSNVAKLVRQSGRLPGQTGPRLLLWPESALPYYLEGGYPFRYYQNQPGESAVATRMAVSELLGADDILITGNDRLVIDDGQLAAAHNSVAAMDAKGDILGWYDKAHLVPYGEYLALRWLLEPLGAARLVPGDVDFWAGPGASTLKLGDGIPAAGIQICYEIIFSGQVVDRANRPDFIFNPSNDAWFGDIGPPQHLAQARLRAIEEGLPVIRSTPTGISAIIAPDGRIVQSLPLGKAGRIDARLPAAYPPTLFARYGNILPIFFALLLIGFALFLVARQRLRR